MISGGPLIPAINKMRRAGVISHSTMMHLYQIASLSMQFGLLATFGYQYEYALLTVGTFALSWGYYAIFSLLFQDPASETAQEASWGGLLEFSARANEAVAKAMAMATMPSEP